MNYLKEELYAKIKSDDKVFDFLQNSSLDGLYYRDLENPEREWRNEQFWRTLGYEAAELSDRKATLREMINRKDLAAAARRLEQHLADPAVPYDQVIRYRHQKGHTVYLRCRGLAIRNEEGKATRLLGTHVNVTNEKEKAVLLERSQEAARIGTWSVDLVTERVEWDKMTRAIHQVPKDFQPSITMGLDFYKEGSSRETIARLLDRAMTTGEGFDTELQLITATDREIWVRAIGRSDFSGGKCTRVFGIFQDIDVRRRNEERMLNYSILEAKSKEMEQFSYIASHDLREPLLTIKGYLNVIREDFAEALPTEVLGYMDTITGAADRMDTLMKGLLDYSRLSEIKQLQEVNLEDLLGEVIVDLTSAAKGIDISYDYENLPSVAGYPLELKVLLQNLIGNAIKYRRISEPLRIKVTCEDLQEGWRISVHDNGIGIAEKNLKKIFKLFCQLHQKGLYDGSGIGLANCKKIVELHGGRIWAESTLGEGSVFRLTIQTRVELEGKRKAM